MKIIAFDWTTDAFLAGRKRRTRRDWVDEYAARFKAGETCQAWNHSPRVRMRNPRKVGELKLITEPRRESTSLMEEVDYELEGFAFMEERGINIWGKTPRKAFEDWKAMDRFYWVVDFVKTLPVEDSVSK